MKNIPTELEGEFIIRVMDMPYGSNGVVIYDDDDFANIYINARSGAIQQKKSVRHELDHVEHDDIHSGEDIAVIEARARRNSGESPVDLARTIPHLKRASDLLPPAPPPDPTPLPAEPPSPYCWRSRYAEIEADLAGAEDAYLDPDE